MQHPAIFLAGFGICIATSTLSAAEPLPDKTRWDFLIPAIAEWESNPLGLALDEKLPSEYSSKSVTRLSSGLYLSYLNHIDSGTDLKLNFSYIFAKHFPKSFSDEDFHAADFQGSWIENPDHFWANGPGGRILTQKSTAGWKSTQLLGSYQLGPLLGQIGIEIDLLKNGLAGKQRNYSLFNLQYSQTFKNNFIYLTAKGNSNQKWAIGFTDDDFQDVFQIESSLTSGITLGAPDQRLIIACSGLFEKMKSTEVTQLITWTPELGVEADLETWLKTQLLASQDFTTEKTGNTSKESKNFKIQLSLISQF